MTCGFCQRENHTAAMCFERIKAEVSVIDVLRRYGLEAKQIRNGYASICPLPLHAGERKNTPFRITENGRGFHCWSCQATGNVVELVRQMEGLDAIEAVKQIAEWFPIDDGNAVPRENEVPTPAPRLLELPPPKRNIPLREKWRSGDGRLKNLLFDHPYLRERGFSAELCERFGVGYIRRGRFAGRIGFPICNAHGEVLAYSTRSTKPDCPHGDRWRHPRGFEKSLELYAIERVRGGRVVVVESFWGVLACARASVEIPAVALMGSDLSEAQERLLRPFDVVLMLDGDEAGKASTKRIAERFAGNRKDLRLVLLPEGQQPDSIEPDVLKKIIEGA